MIDAILSWAEPYNRDLSAPDCFSVMAFHPDISQLQLYSAGADYKVRVWNLSNSECLAVVAAHYSAVTSIVFSQDGTTVLT